MEKHQIIRPRRLVGTPFIKFSHKVSGLICVASLVIGLAYNHWRSERALYIIKSGYYNDEELTKHTMRMSLMPLFTFKKRDEIQEATEEQNIVSTISGIPKDVSEASINI